MMIAAAPTPACRLPYDVRLRIGKALDQLVCDDSTPEQVDRFIATFAEFGLTIISTPREIDGGRFEGWSLDDLIGQCRMQTRDQLDPEFCSFMAELAKRLAVDTSGHRAPEA